jgi:hypothetical protein
MKFNGLTVIIKRKFLKVSHIEFQHNLWNGLWYTWKIQFMTWCKLGFIVMLYFSILLHCIDLILFAFVPSTHADGTKANKVRSGFYYGWKLKLRYNYDGNPPYRISTKYETVCGIHRGVTCKPYVSLCQQIGISGQRVEFQQNMWKGSQVTSRSP